jgi:hypothetical protein
MMQRHRLPPGALPDFYAGAKDVSVLLRWSRRISRRTKKEDGSPYRVREELAGRELEPR